MYIADKKNSKGYIVILENEKDVNFDLRFFSTLKKDKFMHSLFCLILLLFLILSRMSR